MPCTVDLPAIDYVDIRPEKLKKLKKMKKRGERAEEALCRLCRAVIEKDPSILVELLSNDNRFLKTWRNHQDYDLKAGRSYYTFDPLTRSLFLWLNGTEAGKKEVKVIPTKPLEELSAADFKPIVTVGSVGEASKDDLSLEAALAKALAALSQQEGSR